MNQNSLRWKRSGVVGRGGSLAKLSHDTSFNGFEDFRIGIYLEATGFTQQGMGGCQGKSINLAVLNRASSMRSLSMFSLSIKPSTAYLWMIRLPRLLQQSLDHLM